MTSAPTEKLSRMEMRVLLLLSAGETVRGVAAIIERSPRTVETHVEAVKRKLNARNRAAMVAIACDRGILPPGSLERASAVIAARSAQPEDPEPQDMTTPTQA